MKAYRARAFTFSIKILWRVTFVINMYMEGLGFKETGLLRQ